MKRHSFRTKNMLELYSLLYISLMCIVLLVFFLVLGNIGRIVRSANLDSGQADLKVMESALQEGTGPLTSSRITAPADPSDGITETFAGGNGEGKVALYGGEKILSALASQMVIMEQSYDRIALPEAASDCELLVVGKEELSPEETSSLTAYVENGGNLWLTKLTPQIAEDPELQKLLGIQSAGKAKKWPGIRFSGDLALGSVMEEPEYPVSAIDLTLSKTIKLYAAALPKGYKKMETKDLPPLIWRYAADEKAGSVYVCNGDYMDTEVLYYLLPMILSEQKENYIYGVLNSYCVFVEGFPYTENEERESWQRLYSRDKMAIAQDLLSTQYLNYYTNYGARITYFSRDYRELLDAKDRTLTYYTDNIENSMGLLALKDEKGLFLENDREKLDIRDWDEGFSFTDQGNYCLPVNFEYTLAEQKEADFRMLGSAVGLGYYAFSNDVDLLLDYEGEADVWDEYCKNQEVVFGVGKRDGGWLDRISAAQALERVHTHLNADVDIAYSSEGIEINTDADRYWLILKGKTKNIGITGGTAKSIGDRCWLVEVTGGHAVIRYK